MMIIVISVLLLGWILILISGLVLTLLMNPAREDRPAVNKVNS